MTIDEYKKWYKDQYGKNPSEKLIESFCKSNGIQIPDKDTTQEDWDEFWKDVSPEEVQHAKG